MKILLIAPHPFFQERGTPIAVKLLIETLSEFGHSIDLLTFDPIAAASDSTLSAAEQAAAAETQAAAVQVVNMMSQAAAMALSLSQQ